MTTIRLFADDAKLRIADPNVVASGGWNSAEIQVAFGGKWSDYEKTAVFFTSWDETVYEVLLENGKCAIPHEVLSKSGYLYIGVRGVHPEKAVKPTTLVKYKIERGAPAGDGVPVDPTPDLIQQIFARLDAQKEFVQNAVDQTKTSEATALGAKNEAVTAAKNAQVSEQNAGVSANKALNSEKNAKASEQTAVEAANKAETIVNNAAWISADVDENGHLIVTQSDNFNGATFALTGSGHLEVAYV